MTSTIELNDRISKCRRILEADPSSQIFAALAESYRKKGELDKAFRVCQGGLKIHPSYGAAHVVMAKIDLDRGLYDWAESEAKEAAKLDGWTRNIELLLSEIYIYKGQFDAAIKLLNRLSQSDPGNSQIKKLLSIAQRLPEEHKRMIGVSAANNLTSDLTRVPIDEKGGDTETAPPEPIEKSYLNAAGLVEQAVEIDGVNGALFVNFDGLIVESEWLLQMDQVLFGASFSEIINELNVQLFENSFGKLESLLIETEGPTFLISRKEEGMFLFATTETTNLGAVKMKIEKLLNLFRS